MTGEERNMELMQTLVDAWNAQDLVTFMKQIGLSLRGGHWSFLSPAGSMRPGQRTEVFRL
jgi:putative NADH-flavin reductase